MWRLVAVVCLLAACGDDSLPAVQLDASDDLVIVAHQDDDLLFMQPDLVNRLRAHHPVTVVYVTAGDAGNGVSAANDRYHALMAAYGLVLGASDWTCGELSIDRHLAQRCRLADAGLALVFLGIPDGGVSGNYQGSLLSLWQAQIPKTTTVAEQPTTYTRDELVSAVSALITGTRPKVIRTLDVSGTHGGDHSDHMLVGAITALAIARAGYDAEVLSYRGYNTNGETAQLSETLFDDASQLMRAYEACMTGCGECGVTMCPEVADGRYNGFLHRRYATAMRRPPLAGTLRIDSGCIIVDGSGAVSLGDCANATPLTFEPGGNIRAGDRCLVVGASGDVALGKCGAGARSDFLLDEDGHLFTGIAPDPAPDMLYEHATCLAGDGGKVRVVRCGGDVAPHWDLHRASETTPRDVLGITATGRVVRIADLTGNGRADLCAVENNQLFCALGDAAGGFAPATVVANLPIEPESLSLGDVDGDGMPDACGRDVQGVLCATAASGFVAARWSYAFGAPSVTKQTDATLGIVDHAVCGRSTAGVVCATRKATDIYSRWPAPDVAVWPGDLDGDGKPDWCSATEQGPACGLAADHHLSDEGVSWGYSSYGVVEGSVDSDGAPLDVNHVALGDVSGDGRADLCMVVGSRVECAVSQGRAFGPRWLALELPRGTEIRALWLGDVDGDGKADPCVDDGTAITCAPSP